MTQKYHRWLGALTLGLAAYLLFGCGQWFLYSGGKSYLRQSLYNLAAFELLHRLNRYALMFAICVIGMLILSVVARSAQRWLARVVLRVKVVDDVRCGAIVTSVGLLFFVAGIAASFGYEASLASASTLPPSLPDVLRGILMIFSHKSSLDALLLLIIVCVITATLFVGMTMGIIIRLQRRHVLEEKAQSLMASRWLRAAGVCQLAFLAAFNFWAWWITTGAAGGGPNVVLISIDTLRADHLETYGYARRTAPNIARLADIGMVFANAYAEASWTLPSMASLHTGLYPYQHGAVEATAGIRNETIMLAEAMQG